MILGFLPSPGSWGGFHGLSSRNLKPLFQETLPFPFWTSLPYFRGWFPPAPNYQGKNQWDHLYLLLLPPALSLNPSSAVYIHPTSWVCVPFPRPAAGRVRPPHLTHGLLHSPSCAQILSCWTDSFPVQPPSVPPCQLRDKHPTWEGSQVGARHLEGIESWKQRSWQWGEGAYCGYWRIKVQI